MLDRSGTNNLGAQLQGIAQVLRNRKLRLPLYQRPYSWTNEQVQIFWNDLRSAFLLKNPTYYLGTLLLAAGHGVREYEVIDGQQRLTTTSLLLAALRDAFIESGEHSRADALKNDYLCFTDLRNGTVSPRLSLNTADDGIYREIVTGTNTTVPGLATSAQRLLEAYKLLKKNLKDELVTAGDDWRERVIAWTEFLELQVCVIVLDVSSTTDAFTIFETLNDRGLALSVADLLKNHLYSLAGDNNLEVAGHWEQMIATLGEGGDEQTVLDYLRHFWSSWNGAVRERDLYRGFRSQVTSKKSAITVAQHLAAESPNYLALVTGESSLWPEGSLKKREAEVFQVLPIQQCRPLFLATMANFEPEEIAETIQLIVSFWVRSEFSKKQSTLAIEKTICSSAMRIRAKKIKNNMQLAELLREGSLSDVEFKTALVSNPQVSKRLSKYLILALRNLSLKKPSPQLVGLDEFTRANLVPLTSATESISTSSNPYFMHSLANYKIEFKRSAGTQDHPAANEEPFVPFSELIYGQSIAEVLLRRQEMIAGAVYELWSLKV